MANFNKVILIGNVTRDPEVKYTPKGTAVTDVSIAINRFIPAGEGTERREEVTFVEVTLWGRIEEIAGEYAKKGRMVFIEGRLQLDTWEDRTTGQKRSRLRVVGEQLQLLGSPRSGSSGGHHSGGNFDESGSFERPSSANHFRGPQPSQPAPSNPAPSYTPLDESDDIPF